MKAHRNVQLTPEYVKVPGAAGDGNTIMLACQTVFFYELVNKFLKTEVNASANKADHFLILSWYSGWMKKYGWIGVVIVGWLVSYWLVGSEFEKNKKLEIVTRDLRVIELEEQVASGAAEFERFKMTDQVVRNNELEKEISEIQKTYKLSVVSYQNLMDLRTKTTKTAEMDKLFAGILDFLGKRNYASASAGIAELDKKINDETAKLIVVPVAANVPVNNAPPGSGYSRQQVQSDAGTFTVSLVAGDMGSTKIIVDTAADGDCGNNCPVLPLATYVARSGAYAGVNGSYFCPASYPDCAGKTNSFDLLVMNKNKRYFNSDNNVYSNNPAVIFNGGSMRFVTAASQWGRDTGVDGVLSNYPLTVFNSNVAFGGDSDPKKGSKGNRSFVANKGGIAYIGVVHSATVAEAARVLKAMGMENALNLDDGGSTALYSGGYKVGPGRDLPNVILFVRK
ncbi:MAG: Copper amine oxidase protein [Microgenomates group bacterium Gr01-1014_16]|nr:MAG: Copper amine oxidase protein [Microgenomates group bacterium Gr01-1014_16]